MSTTRTKSRHHIILPVRFCRSCWQSHSRRLESAMLLFGSTYLVDARTPVMVTVVEKCNLTFKSTQRNRLNHTLDLRRYKTAEKQH